MNISPDQMKQFAKNALRDVVEDMEAAEETDAKYSLPQYMQYVDGKVLNYDKFVEHMKAQMSNLWFGYQDFREDDESRRISSKQNL